MASAGGKAIGWGVLSTSGCMCVVIGGGVGGGGVCGGGVCGGRFSSVLAGGGCIYSICIVLGMMTTTVWQGCFCCCGSCTSMHTIMYYTICTTTTTIMTALFPTINPTDCFSCPNTPSITIPTLPTTTPTGIPHTTTTVFTPPRVGYNLHIPPIKHSHACRCYIIKQPLKTTLPCCFEAPTPPQTPSKIIACVIWG